MEDDLLIEDSVIDILCEYLKNSGWGSIKKKKGHKRGVDIEASKNGKILIVEAKGAKGSPNSPVTKKSKFSSGDIKTHFGKALVKVLEEKNKNPDIDIAIAYPNNEYIKKVLIYATPEIKKFGIKLFWISDNGNVEEE